jgi:hypothetical protein
MSAVMKEVDFEAFINGAIDYCRAGDELLKTCRTESLSFSPIYNAFFIAAELALKAFLRFNGELTVSLRTKWKHDLTGMFKEASARGLKPNAADALELRNVINLLQNGNKKQAFRYFIYESRTMPEVNWTSRVLNNLISLIKKQTSFTNAEPRTLVKIDIVVGRPMGRKLLVDAESDGATTAVAEDQILRASDAIFSAYGDPKG